MAVTINSLSELSEVLNSGTNLQENVFVPEKDQMYNVVSIVAYHIGVRREYFNEEQNFDKDIFLRLKQNKNCRIIRNLCILRSNIEHKFTKIHAEVQQGREVLNMEEYINLDAVNSLLNDGVKLTQKGHTYPLDYILEINGLIQDRINNCQTVFPDWLNLEYVKNLFIMPDGRSEAGIKEVGNIFRENKLNFPYQMYLNWPMPYEGGNILLNDRKFVVALYHNNYDEFTEMNRLIDVSEQIKGNIYDFLEQNDKTIMVVDCENSDVYNLISMLNSLELEQHNKINKIILVNDVHQNIGWAELTNFTDIPIEHVMAERVKENKSLVDGKVIARVCVECFKNNVDSFVLLSSDSDFWSLIDELKGIANFLIMLEHDKSAYDYKERLIEADVLYCYLDDFYSGEQSEQQKTSILLRTIENKMKKYQFNIKQIFAESLLDLRIDMDEAQREQFFKKYLKTLILNISDDGDVQFDYKTRF